MDFEIQQQPSSVGASFIEPCYSETATALRMDIYQVVKIAALVSYVMQALAALGGALPQRIQRALPALLQASIRGRRGYQEHLFPGETSSQGPNLGVIYSNQLYDQ